MSSDEYSGYKNNKGYLGSLCCFYTSQLVWHINVVVINFVIAACVRSPTADQNRWLVLTQSGCVHID